MSGYGGMQPQFLGYQQSSGYGYQGGPGGPAYVGGGGLLQQPMGMGSATGAQMMVQPAAAVAGGPLALQHLPSQPAPPGTVPP